MKKQSKPSTLSPFYDYRYEAAAAGDIPTGLALNSPALNETSPMWSPLPKKVASSVLDDFYLDDSGVTSPELKPQNTSAPPQSLPVPQSTTQNQHFQISPPQITVQQAQPIPSNLVSPQILIEKSTSEPLKGEIPYQGSTFLSQSPESDVEQEKEQEEKPTTRSGNPDRRPRCKYNRPFLTWLLMIADISSQDIAGVDKTVNFHMKLQKVVPLGKLKFKPKRNLLAPLLLNLLLLLLFLLVLLPFPLQMGVQEQVQVQVPLVLILVRHGIENFPQKKVTCKSILQVMY